MAHGLLCAAQCAGAAYSGPGSGIASFERPRRRRTCKYSRVPQMSRRGSEYGICIASARGRESMARIGFSQISLSILAQCIPPTCVGNLPRLRDATEPSHGCHAVLSDADDRHKHAGTTVYCSIIRRRQAQRTPAVSAWLC